MKNIHGTWIDANYLYCWRHCSHCGSIHPEDLMLVLKSGAKLRGSDWKYGWPHKFYIETPLGNAKWYNDHIMEEPLGDDVIDELIAILEKHSGIQFSVTDGKLFYVAPYSGYQK